jgi:hypothetical protein
VNPQTHLSVALPCYYISHISHNMRIAVATAGALHKPTCVSRRCHTHWLARQLAAHAAAGRC